MKSSKSRTRSVPQHRTFHISKKKLKQHASLPSAWKLFKETTSLVRNNKRLFLGIALFNAVISFVFVQGIGGVFDVVEFKKNIEELLGEESGQITTGVALFGYLLGSAGTGASQTGGTYQLFLVLITSLAVIWGVRQVLAGEKPRFKDSFYKGMYPLIPFLLVLFVVALQLVPLLIGNLVFTTVIQNELAVTAIEKIIWLLLFISLALLSAYMIISSLFALYIATLPDMTPLKALRSARELVLHRRISIGLRLVALPIVLTFFSALIFIPLLMFATPVASILFVAMTSLSLVIIHIYVYLLYRALI